MATRGTRSEKVKRIFHHFDLNRDGGLNREEMSALVVAVNPRVKFSDEQINAILDEVFRTYGDFIDNERGLTFDGLLRTYDDGAGDVDRDFDALGIELKPMMIDNDLTEEAASSSSMVDDRVNEPHKNQRTAAWASSPNHGIIFDETWKLVDDLEILIKKLKSKQAKDGKSRGDNSDAYSDPGWSREFGPSVELSDRMVFWDESSHEYTVFVKELNSLRTRADGSRSREEAFDGQIAIGRDLYDHQLYKEALVSFKRARDLQPTDVRPHFRTGNCLYVLGQHSEAETEFRAALEAAEIGGNQWSYLLPQIHVNLGIALEGEGMVISACEHYREAAILCPTHFRALKLLGSALFGVGEYKAAIRALEEAIYLKNDYADAHCDLASSLHAIVDDDNAIKEFQKAIDLKPGHVDALYNLGGLYMDMGRYQRASEMYTRVLTVSPNHWRAQLNKAVSLLGAGENEDAKKSMKEALKMTNRVELHDAMSHLKQLQKKNVVEAYIEVEPSRFKIFNEKTTSRRDLGIAIDIRRFQRITRLNRCNVELLRKEMSDEQVPLSYSGSGAPQRSIRKASLEVILRRLLGFLKPETFVGAVKAINQKILSVLEDSESGRLDLGMFLAIIAPICDGPPNVRKRVAYDALLWRPVNQGSSEVKRVDICKFINLLRAIYVPEESVPLDDEVVIDGETSVSFIQFSALFDDAERGFGVMPCLVKLEQGDRQRHGNRTCVVCRYPIIGSRFREMKSRFNLCGQCYSEGKVPPVFKQEEYRFKEYTSQGEAMKDKFTWLGLHSKNPNPPNE
ncbi:uncharacterized TPR repeat-containing protein At1g05150-like [Impatiens glandulifera]|uniref:uncharacterized TPR repeat-containing protein At1g05150-like n=1 Tax=Impatiens glandulifera TaxID=253017 RepID=UPI001FB17872|nr:uncharacterized TPR repeat-containing protein At1g05150-like [Impatiens glandulifera]